MSDLPEFHETKQQSAATPLASADAKACVGSQIGDYEIRGVIGEDDTGVLYSGRYAAKGGQVTLKILHDRCARKKDVVEQFIGDTRAARPIRHLNLVEVIDVGITPQGSVFLAMEYLPGESLRSRLRQVQRLPPFEAINVMRQAARGLGAAHEAGIVHGALTPDNIFLCKHEGRRRVVRRSKAKGMRYAVEPETSFDMVKLLDFGTARLSGPVAGDEAGFCGTLHYLSPEQAQGQRADQRCDIYSLGVVFYEMVTGTVPFAGDSLPDILRAHALGEVIPPSRRAPGVGIDARIDALILRCLKKNPPLRVASTAELCAALDDCITDSAFLRDAHRLPGITESGIDLSQGSQQSRQEPERSADAPSAAPVAEKPVAAPVPQKPALSPVVRIAPPAVAKTAVASIPAKPAAAPMAEKPATQPSALLPRPAAALVAEKPMTPVIAPVVQTKEPAVPVIAPVVQAEKPAAPVIASVIQDEDPAAAMITPPPVVQAEDPAAAMITPPPVVQAAERPADLTTRLEDRERPEDILNIEDRPMRFPAEVDVRPGRPKHAHPSWRVFALLGLLLLVGGIAVWTERGYWLPQTGPFNAPTTPAAASPPPLATPPTAPVAASPVAAPPAPAAASPVAAPPAPAAPNPVAAPPAPAAANPVAAPAAPAVPMPTAAPSPAPSAASPVAAPAAPVAPGPVAAPAAALPESASPTRLHKAATRGSGKKPASSRSHATLAKRPRRAARAVPMPTATAVAPAAEPLAESQPPAPSKAASEPESAEPANAEDLLREAQRTRKRGHFAAAISKARAALEAEPTPAQAAQAYELIGICACSIADVSAAREAASHLAGASRDVVKAMCEAMGQKIE